MKLINDYFGQHQKIVKNLDFGNLERVINLIEDKFKQGKTIFTCGNGGSAHTASHFITDWIKMGNTHTKNQYNGICLNDNMGLVTAYANDFDYKYIFSHQLKTLLKKGDLVIAVSGSGNSPNVVEAIKFANSFGSDTIALVGYDGGKIKKIARYHFHVPSFDMQICEDIHLKFGHLVMKKICNLSIEN